MIHLIINFILLLWNCYEVDKEKTEQKNNETAMKKKNGKGLDFVTYNKKINAK